MARSLFKTVNEGLHGATAVQKQHTNTENRSSRKRRADPTVVVAAISVLGGFLKSIFDRDNNEVTVINTMVERYMIPSTERASSGKRPISLNTENRKFPEELQMIAINNVIHDYKVIVPILSARVKINGLLSLSLFEKMTDYAYVNDILAKNNFNY